jgi:hypothetical protein
MICTAERFDSPLHDTAERFDYTNFKLNLYNKKT